MNRECTKYVLTPTNQGLLKDHTALKRILHTWISASSIACVIYGTIPLLYKMSNEKYLNNEYLTHGYEFSPYFLSLWVVVSNITYYLMYSTIDIVEVYFNDNKKLLRMTDYIHKVASYLLFTVIFPVSMVVLLGFWTVFLWDREKFIPSIVDDVFPLWMNYIMHTGPVPLSMIYMFTSNRHEPPKRPALAGTIAFISIYTALFASVKITKGKWVYLLFNHIPPLVLNICFVCFVIATLVFFHLGYQLNSVFKEIKSHLSILVGS